MGLLQARILEWVAICHLPFARGPSQPRDQTQVPHIAGRLFITWATRIWGRNWNLEKRLGGEAGMMEHLESRPGLWDNYSDISELCGFGQGHPSLRGELRSLRVKSPEWTWGQGSDRELARLVGCGRSERKTISGSDKNLTRIRGRWISSPVCKVDPSSQTWVYWFSQFSCSVVSDSLRPHGVRLSRPPCPSPTPGVYSNSCPLIVLEIVHFLIFLKKKI